MNSLLELPQALQLSRDDSPEPIVQQPLHKSAYNGDTLSNALSQAAASGDVQRMQYFIDRGAHGLSALIIAVNGNHASAVQLLLDTFSYSPSTLASALCRAMFTWLFLRYGPDSASLPMTHGPSQAPYTANEPTIVRMLHEKNARLSIIEYCRLLEVMIPAGDGFAMQFLENKAYYTTKEALPDDYLLSLAIYNRHDATSLLFAEPVLPLNEVIGPDEVHDDSSMKPLVGTIAPFATPTDSTTPSPLLAAVMNRDTDLCALLLSRGKIGVNEWCSYIPNNRATSYYGPDMMTSIPDQECSWLLRFSFGLFAFHECPLLYSIARRDTAIVAMLIKHGADPWLNRPHKSILDLAARNDMLPELIALTQDAGLYHVNKMQSFDGASLLHYAARYSKIDVVDQLCQQGANTNAVDFTGKTPLHLAVATGNSEMINRLYKHGADLNAVDTKGRTPLYDSVELAGVETTKALLWAGADVMARNGFNKHRHDVPETPFELASRLAKDMRDATLPLTTTLSEKAETQMEIQGEEMQRMQERREEIASLLDAWLKRNTDHLSTDAIQRDAEDAEERAAVRLKSSDSTLFEDGLVDRLSDDESVHWSEDEDEDESRS